MLRPSYTDLLEVINQKTTDITIVSRYTIVIAAAKRARQLVDHAEPLINNIKVNKPVSIAVNELNEGKIKVRQSTSTVFSDEMCLADDREGEFEGMDEMEE